MKRIIAAIMLSAATTGAQAYCPKSGEQEDGQNKICYYKCLSGTKAITIGRLQMCPLSINDNLRTPELPRLQKSKSLEKPKKDIVLSL